MFKRVFPLIIWIIFAASSIVCAQGNDLDFSKLKYGLISVKNPFKSQLPKVEKPTIGMPDTHPENLPDDQSSPTKPIPVTPPPEIKEKPLPNITINGIIWNSARPQAIVNGKIVDVGDTIAEIYITDIRKTGIDGRFDGRKVTLQP